MPPTDRETYPDSRTTDVRQAISSWPDLQDEANLPLAGSPRRSRSPPGRISKTKPIAPRADFQDEANLLPIESPTRSQPPSERIANTKPTWPDRPPLVSFFKPTFVYLLLFDRSLSAFPGLVGRIVPTFPQFRTGQGVELVELGLEQLLVGQLRFVLRYQGWGQAAA